MPYYNSHESCFRWLHLSDFHTGKDDIGQSQFFKHILDEVRDRVDTGRMPHAVFLTGDIANRGKASEYYKFLEEFYLPLTTILQSNGSNKIFCIPGNHDVDREEAKAVQKYGITEKLEHFLDPNAEGFRLREDLLKRFRAFADFDATSAGADSEHWLFSSQGFSTNRIEIDHHTIGVLCLNTAWLSDGDKDQLELSPGELILVEGLESIKDCQTRIVLGHHPIDWFTRDEQRRTRALFGQYNVIYLHGHLHENTFTQEIGAGRQFITIQSGASYQARESKHWVNSFLWSELDYDRNFIRVEPRRWSRDNYEFSHSEPYFPEGYRSKNEQGEELMSYDLPLPMTTKPALEISQGYTWNPPPGWEYITSEFLASQKPLLSEEEDRERRIQFFDGRLPDWNDALSPAIPRRDIVPLLKRAVEDARQREVVQVILLLGAAGEGKSIALRQVVCDLVMSNSEWQVWWTQGNTHTRFPSAALRKLPRSRGTLLVVADEADLIAKDISEAIESLHRENRKNVQFLLCCQKIGWQEAKADRLDWGNNVPVPLPLKDVSERDAELIVDAWRACGDKGLDALKELAPQPEKQAAFFFAKAKSMATSSSQNGSLFGAILAVRHEKDLIQHIRNVLYRLFHRKDSRGINLLKVLMWISAVHVINEAKFSEHVMLTRDIIAQMSGCKPKDVYPRIIQPLGDEAVATMGSRTIYSRHQEIAKAIIQLMPDFGFQFHDECSELIKTVQKTWQMDRNAVTDISHWNRLPIWFFEDGIKWLGNREENKNIGLLLSKALTEGEPDNPVCFVQLANLHRKNKYPEIGIEILASAFKRLRVDREYYYEWATCEGEAGHHDRGIWLAGVSIADKADTKPVNNDRAMRSLAGLAIAQKELYHQYNNPIFLQGCAGATRLGFTLKLNPQTQAVLQKFKDDEVMKNMSVPEALDYLQESIRAAYEQCEDELPSSLLRGDDLTFDNLARLCSKF